MPRVECTPTPETHAVEVGRLVAWDDPPGMPHAGRLVKIANGRGFVEYGPRPSRANLALERLRLARCELRRD